MESTSQIFPRLTGLKCCSNFADQALCVCGEEEIVIRNYINGTISEPMTPEQRAWCVKTADWSGEGHFEKEELEKMHDRELAKSVLEGWFLYAQSQGY